MADPSEILAFWFSDSSRPNWFARDTGFDAEIRTRFLDDFRAARDGALDGWRSAPDSLLALVILLDQFPRNLFRNSALSFATDDFALAYALHGLERGMDIALAAERCSFLYMPLMHSESLADQQRCVALFKPLGREENLKFAIWHCDIIARFGRFPHRNAVLGRNSTAEELAFLKDFAGF